MSQESKERIINILNKIPVNAAVIFLCLLWLLPTLGLLITSFRPAEAVSNTGWWTALSNPEPSASVYNRLCESCHGDNFQGVEGVNLLDPALLDSWTTGDRLRINLRRAHQDIPEMPEASYQPVPSADEVGVDPDEGTALRDYLYFEAGRFADVERFTISNYVDVMVGFSDKGTSYQEMCDNAEAEGVEPRAGLNCDFWEDATEGETIFRAMINSFIVSIPATILPILFAGFAAYAFSWLDFNGRKVMFAILVGLQIVPLQMTLVPIFRLYADLGLNGTFIGVWLFHTGFGMPYAIYLMRNFIAALPRELMESAYLDGAGHFRVFWRIVLPLALPAIAALGIFQFLWVWNDLLIALIFLGNDAPVLTYRLSQMVDSLGGGWYRMTAAAFVSMAVPLIVFLGFQRFFVRGLLAGSVKG